jgi:Leucine Rich repeat
MSDVMAIVAKAVFEKAAGKAPALGTALGLDRYVSANKGLTPLAEGGRLFLVTVRPPDEALWLVAVLDHPRFSGTEWVGKQASTAPLTDLSALKSKLQFESGKGLPTTAGTLGMSLQTPRVLTEGDVALLNAALGGAVASAPAAGSKGSKDGARAAAAVEDPAAPLLRAVLAAPADEAPRRALGEHWRATGEPRGELVALEQRLRERVSRHLGLNLRARRAELLAAHAERWWPWPLEAHRQRGGLLSAISLDASDAGALATAAKVLAAEPVTELTVTGLDEDSIGQLARAPWLARITHLLARGPIGDEGFAALLKSRHLAGLEVLNLSGNELSSEGLAALDKQLPALRRLVLTNNALGDEGAEALAKWKHLGNLRALYLTACELSSEGLAALLGGGQLASLEKLTLSYNELGDEGAAVLAAHAGGLGRLQFLELKDISLRGAGSRALAAARLPALRRLDVSGNQASYAELGATYGAAVRR